MPESSTADPPTPSEPNESTASSWRLTAPTVRTRTAAAAAAPLTIAMFSTVTATEAVTVMAVPRATRIVAGPWPRMRSERARSIVTPSATS